MLNRRDLIKNLISISGLSLTGLRLEAEEIKPYYSIQSQLNNGIDKIYNISDYYDNQSKHKKSIPLYPINMLIKNTEINDLAWQTLLSASLNNVNKIYPASSFVSFIEQKCTDLFVDKTIYKYVCHTYMNDPDFTPNKMNIHSVNLAQYYPFYIDSLGGKFRKYTSNLLIACNLSEKNSAKIIVKDTNYIGVAILDNTHFMLGQI